MSELESKPLCSLAPNLLLFTSFLYFKQEQLKLTGNYEDDRHCDLKSGLPQKPRCTQLLCPGRGLWKELGHELDSTGSQKTLLWTWVPASQAEPGRWTAAMIPIACLRGRRTSRAQFVKFANVLWEPSRRKVYKRNVQITRRVMADIPFALHLLTSASTGDFWGGGGWSAGQAQPSPLRQGPRREP